MDANVDHFNKSNQNEKKRSTYTLLMVGTQDVAHHFHLLAIGIMTGAEAPDETFIFLDLLDKYLIEQGLMGCQ